MLGALVAWGLSLAALAGASPARAELERAACPDLEAGASADDQAQCWFDRHRSGSSECLPGAAVDPCLERAAAWCNDDDVTADDANVDDPQLGNVCLLALAGARRMEAARIVASGLPQVVEEARACHAALTASVRLRVRTTGGRGARVEVDGEARGQVPTDVLLASPWWAHRIVLRVADGTSIERSGDAVRALFDGATCGPRELVVELGGSRARSGARAGRDGSRGGGSLVPGLLLVGAGGAAAIGGVVMLAVAQARADEFDAHAEGTTWTTDLQDQHDSVAPLRVAGSVLLGVGVAAAAAGVIVLATGSDGSSSARAHPARRRRIARRGAVGSTLVVGASADRGSGAITLGGTW